MNPPTTGICLNCPPKPQPLEEELDQIREDLEKVKIRDAKALTEMTLAAVEEFLKKREKAKK